MITFWRDLGQQLQNFSFDWWLCFGLLGQGIFMMRFIVQWWASEKQGKSVLPVTFWYCSVVGAFCLSIYGVHRRDPVIIMGQMVPLAIYLRNLWLIYRPQVDIVIEQKPAPSRA